MPTFELTGPDGGTYQVDAPDENAAVSVFQQLHAGGGTPGRGDVPAETTSAAKDIAKAAPIGVAKGALGLAGLPGDLQEMSGSMIDRAMLGAGHKIMDWTGYGPQASTPERERFDRMYLGIGSGGGLPGSDDLQKGVERVTGPFYKPQTTAGEYAQTVGEFMPGAMIGPGSMARKALAFGVAPAVASETAGQATKGTALEPWARGITAIGATVGGALATGPAVYERMAAQAARGTTPAQFDKAAAVAEAASRQGFPVMASEALQQATGGGTQLGRMQRLAESTRDGAQVLDPIMARRPAQMSAATEAYLDQIAPRSADLSQLGLDVQQGARAAVDATPQGRALAESIERAGPRRTADEAGAIIQPELRQAYDRREGMRAALAEQEYDAARAAPEGVGIERSVSVERPGDPAVTYPKLSRPEFTDAAPRPLEPFVAPSAEAAGPAGESMGRFIARGGGLELTGDLRSQDLHRFNLPGLGNVARDGGKPLDSFWREHLIEHGYLKPDTDGGMARDVRGEVMRKLINEQRGVPSYPIDMPGKVKGRSLSAMQADEYANAKSLSESRLHEDLTNAGVDPASVHPDIRSRAVGALMRGEISDPLEAYERTVGAMKGPLEPYAKSTRIAEEIPHVQFGQVNPQAVVEHIDRSLESAKGSVAKALVAARETMFTRPGANGGRELDLSVTGLHNARDAIGDMIAKAEPAAQRALLAVRERLDRALTSVPEYEHARSGFEAASRNLDPFGTGSVPGRITAQDQASGRFTMPRERAAGALDEGVSGVRDFNAVAGPAARRAYEDYLTTRLLDGASDRAGVSAEKLAGSLRDNADVLGEAASARDRLVHVLSARDGMAGVEAAPIGRMAATGTLREQLATILSDGASPAEVSSAVGALRQQSEPAARGLVREGAGRIADKTVHNPDKRGRPSQFGGAHFARSLREGREGANLQAAMDAAGGPTASQRQQLVDALAATGWREDVGARTAFNRVDLEDLEQAGILGKGAKAASRPLASIHDGVSRAVLGRNTRQLAELLASGPEGVRRIQELQGGGKRAGIIAALMGYRGEQEATGPQRR